MTSLKESCSKSKECTALQAILTECNDRVNSKSATTETCEQELFDYLHCVDHCVSLLVLNSSGKLFKFCLIFIAVGTQSVQTVEVDDQQVFFHRCYKIDLYVGWQIVNKLSIMKQQLSFIQISQIFDSSSVIPATSH